MSLAVAIRPCEKGLTKIFPYATIFGGNKTDSGVNLFTWSINGREYAPVFFYTGRLESK